MSKTDPRRDLADFVTDRRVDTDGVLFPHAAHDTPSVWYSGADEQFRVIVFFRVLEALKASG